ncbi:GNAT domain protein [Kalmanozyma brasiliensis GHG001]|uniref:N-acetyltransferase domain-containing protein n=1 Tax=Kalmanozyma brasiliensis (strain GHG001) TaxID=1365824 RepID=V5GQ88_KALBG|nr:GNAT domain protein [Kalmanozyma brasiliensis GHG001]EST08097.1 GNAT domain protein [Kalmanozyma brasiliensis GHG001]
MTVEPIQFTIRHAQATDAAEIASLGASVFFDSFAHSMPAEDMDNYLKSSYTAERIQSEIEDTHTYLFYVARDDTTNELLGFAQLNRFSDEPCLQIKPPHTIELQRIYTASKAHGRGVGSKLMSQALDYAIAQGFKAIWLGVWEENLKAQKFYLERHAFNKVGDHDFTIGSCVQRDLILERHL